MRSPTDPPPAVILGGGIIAIAVARSLGKAGVPVYALGDGSWDTVRNSRYCTEFVDVGGRAGVQERYFEWLGSGPGRAVILPCSDDGLELVARRRTELSSLGYTLIEANDEAMLAMLDKHETYAVAERVGIPTPRTLAIRGLADMEAVIAQIGFPCALKPRHSHHFAKHFGLRQKLFVTEDRSALESIFSRLTRLGLELIATEIIRGDNDEVTTYYTYLDERGEPLFHFTKRRLRQFPPSFGLGTYHVTDWNSEVADLGLLYCQGAQIRGLAAVEFKRDRRDGRFKLIELNHRFTGATELFRVAGIDLPRLVYNRLAGRGEFVATSYRTGVSLWLPFEDARAFVRYRRRGELSFREWASSVLQRQHFPVFAWDDPRPSLTEYRQLLRVARTKLLGPSKDEHVI